MEFLTDKEKRILFSALTREKKICKEVDKESYREPYEESLTSVIYGLEEKFYYDKIFKEIYQQGRAEAIDEYTYKLEELIKHGIFVSRNGLFEDILNIAEQLKENKNE